ncbi:thioredoxin family protein [Streptomyces sp. NPDC006711]|uniref:thioredoxin family protein n=1 Tax=unclassified Streptomyces TaxID=2593676 RepID=UPI0033C62A37
MASRVHQARENEEFSFILNLAGGPVLAYFFGTWPKAVDACRAMDAVVSGVADEYAGRLTVVKADMARCPEPVRRYGVTGAPTVVLIEDGEATGIEAGAMDRSALKEFLDARL